MQERRTSENLIDGLAVGLAKTVSRRAAAGILGKTMLAGFASVLGLPRLWAIPGWADDLVHSQSSYCPSCGKCQVCDVKAGKCGLPCTEKCEAAALCKKAIAYPSYKKLEQFLASQNYKLNDVPHALVSMDGSKLLGQTLISTYTSAGSIKYQLYYVESGSHVKAIAAMSNLGAIVGAYIVGSKNQLEWVAAPPPPGGGAVGESTPSTSQCHECNLQCLKGDFAKCALQALTTTLLETEGGPLALAEFMLDMTECLLGEVRCLKECEAKCKCPPAQQPCNGTCCGPCENCVKGSCTGKCPEGGTCINGACTNDQCQPPDYPCGMGCLSEGEQCCGEFGGGCTPGLYCCGSDGICCGDQGEELCCTDSEGRGWCCSSGETCCGFNVCCSGSDTCCYSGDRSWCCPSNKTCCGFEHCC
jgi:hypothetical protein